MDNQFNMLLDKFKEFAGSNWIKGINNNATSVGLTLESLLGKQPDSEYFPDYNGIEIKCSQRYSGFPLTLFTSALDGSDFYEMNRLLQTYGKNDEKYDDRKILFANLKSKSKYLFNNYYFSLDVSKDEQKIYILIYDSNNNLIDRKSYIDFATIKNKLETKLSKLALIWASNKKIDNWPYFRYYKIDFYILRNFDKFIDLIDKNIIKISLIGRISRSGTEEGRQKNKGLSFQINKNDIEQLFEHIKEFNCDEDFIRVI